MIKAHFGNPLEKNGRASEKDFTIPMKYVRADGVIQTDIQLVFKPLED